MFYKLYTLDTNAVGNDGSMLDPRKKARVVRMLLFPTSMFAVFLMWTLKGMRQKRLMNDRIGRALYNYKSAL